MQLPHARRVSSGSRRAYGGVQLPSPAGADIHHPQCDRDWFGTLHMVGGRIAAGKESGDEKGILTGSPYKGAAIAYWQSSHVAPRSYWRHIFVPSFTF